MPSSTQSSTCGAYCGSSSGVSRNSLAIIPIVMSPGWMVSVGSCGGHGIDLDEGREFRLGPDNLPPLAEPPPDSEHGQGLPAQRNLNFHANFHGAFFSWRAILMKSVTGGGLSPARQATATSEGGMSVTLTNFSPGDGWALATDSGHDADGLLGAGGLEQVFEDWPLAPARGGRAAERGQAPERAPEGVGFANLDPGLVRDLSEADVRLSCERMLVTKRDVARFAGDHQQFESVAAERRAHHRHVGLAGEQAAGRVAEVEVPGAERDLRMTVPECRQQRGVSGNAAVAARPTRSRAVYPARSWLAASLARSGGLERLPGIRQPPTAGRSAAGAACARTGAARACPPAARCPR